MTGDQQSPSYSELVELVVRLQNELVAEREQTAELRQRIAELEAQLAQNSQNSSRPPSADGLDKPAPKPRSLRRRSARKPGGQDGHEGSTLRQVDNPDEVIRHDPADGCCAGCGRSLADAPQVGVERRQQFDIPPIKVRVVEHQIVERRCACGASTRGQPPAGVDAPVCYGPRTTALAIYLYAGQFLSKQRTAQALAELFGTTVCEGTVATMIRRSAGGLRGFLARVTDRIIAAAVAHFDESGLRVAGRLHWVHSASTSTDSLITVHAKRGKQAMDAAGVLPSFTGIAVRDAWAPYDRYPAATPALCNAHLLRELQAVTDLAPAGRWCWASQAADALRQMKRLVDTAAETGQPVPADRLAEQTTTLHSAALIGKKEAADRNGKLQAKEHALARRILDRQDDYLRFTDNPQVPFDNNAAEQQIRMVKLRQKVSGCMRTLTGAEQFCAIRSYLATASKHGIRFFDALVMLAEGQPWMPETA